VLASLVIKIEYCRTLHRGSKEPSRPSSLSGLPATEKAPTSRFPATKSPSISCYAPAFLPGSGKYVECGVTRSKQTTATFLPGSRFAHCHARTSLANALSNRELHLLELTLTHRKQTIAPRPNRELSTNPRFRNSVLRSVFTSHSLAVTLEASLAAHPYFAFLTETASHSETGVTHSKQTIAPFLTGARIAHLRPLALRHCEGERFSGIAHVGISNPCVSTSPNFMLHARPIQIFLRPTI
jgi:hypothetical protein